VSKAFPTGKLFALGDVLHGRNPTRATDEAVVARRAHARHTAVLLLTMHDRSPRKETHMQHRTDWKIIVLAFVCTLILVPRVRAQQVLSPQPHAPGTVLAADKHDDDEDEEHEHGRRGHEGRMGHEGMRLQQHLDRLTQQLKLTDQQRAQVRTLLYTHAKDMIRLQAELATLRLDVPPLLEADPVDLAKVKQQFQAIGAKEADLHLAHVTAMQEIRKVLTPEQQQQFKTLQGRMMHEGGRREHRERE
jgi:Spy/CpxP family protein refolding chaperone